MAIITRHPIVQLRRLGVQRGLVGGNRAWLAVGVGLWLARAGRRALSKVPEIAATEILKPGESMTITAIAPPLRRSKG